MPPSPFKARRPWAVRLFRWYARRYVAARFHALRVARAGASPSLPAGPVVVAMSHPSWWDPMIAAVLAQHLPGRVIVAPMDAHALRSYRFFAWLGLFGLERRAAGWRRLLAVADEVAARPDAVLWITPQGKFADPRLPVVLKPGIGHVLHRLRGATLLPVALEYPFWSERQPEALVRFGEPLPVTDGRALTPEAWTDRARAALEDTRLALADDATARDPERFLTLVAGRGGVGGIYDLWRRLRARLAGERFDPEHAAVLRAREAS